MLRADDCAESALWFFRLPALRVLNVSKNSPTVSPDLYPTLGYVPPR